MEGLEAAFEHFSENVKGKISKEKKEHKIYDFIVKVLNFYKKISSAQLHRGRGSLNFKRTTFNQTLHITKTEVTREKSLNNFPDSKIPTVSCQLKNNSVSKNRFKMKDRKSFMTPRKNNLKFHETLKESNSLRKSALLLNSEKTEHNFKDSKVLERKKVMNESLLSRLETPKKIQVVSCIDLMQKHEIEVIKAKEIKPVERLTIDLNQTLQIQCSDMNLVREANNTPTFEDAVGKIDLLIATPENVSFEVQKESEN